MNNSFLSYVAQDLIDRYGHNLSRVAVVFPNKRASLFLNQHLARLAGRPIWSPAYLTISELFRQQTTLQVADPIKLVCDLHKTFVEETGIDETLDHFYGWGQMLIADFDDVDKNMADPQQVFRNLRDLHELDDISYLTEEQRRVIAKFFSNFTDDHNSELKRRFLQLWSRMLDIYQAYNKRLKAQGLAYEGVLYRAVVESELLDLPMEKYIFVGFNMMQQAELQLCQRLQREGRAEFYWDYDKYYMEGNQEAGHFIKQYLEAFPNKLALHPDYDHIYNNLAQKKDITYVSASTDNIQARYVHDWLLENDRWKAGRQTAIVLADESLLSSVIHSLPEEVESVNVTIGYPLQQSPFYSLLKHLMALQTIGHPKGSDTYRLRYVLQVLRHPYAQYLSPQAAEVIRELEEQKQFYPTRAFLTRRDTSEDEGLDLIFRNLEAEDNFCLALMDTMLGALKLIGVHARQLEDQLFQESLFRTYTLVNRLAELMRQGDLSVDIVTLERLLGQLVATTSIPFHGEPIEGIQIMGVLETRNLDFDHLLILSAGEGKLPKGVSDASFIPYSLRKAFGLTTIDHKVAIYAYYFHRLLQRAGDITITYNNATDDGQRGEMSRFMLQLLVESPHDIVRQSLTAGQKPQWGEATAANKDEQTLQTLSLQRSISPTYLGTYLRCQKRFYYKYVKGIKEPDQLDDDEVDNRIFGNIFHLAAQLFYLRQTSQDNLIMDGEDRIHVRKPFVVGKDAFDYALKSPQLIDQLVDEAFRQELFKMKSEGGKLRYNGLQLINRAVIKDYLKRLLRIDRQYAPLTIVGLECKVSTQLAVDMTDGQRETFTIGGYIDRLDATGDQMRVIDYKTGRPAGSHPAEVADLFDSFKLKLHTDYYLQTLLYALIVAHDKRLNPASLSVAPALLFIQKSGAEGYDPVLSMGKEQMNDATAYENGLLDGISQLLRDIHDSSIPFTPTDDQRRCTSCPYQALCMG